MEPHAKIINAVAKRILAPQGFFRKGSSRIWLQDNGWFLTMVEFQPSGFFKGTFLNVGMHFLWGKPLPDWIPACSFDYGYRVMPPQVPEQFITYTGDDGLFERQVETMANAAATIAAEYRKCTDLAYARNLICNENTGSAGWNEYNKAMLCFLSADVQQGQRHLRYFLEIIRNRAWDKSDVLERISEQEIAARSDTSESARQMVLEMIQNNRAACLARPSFKGMHKEPYTG